MPYKPAQLERHVDDLEKEVVRLNVRNEMLERWHQKVLDIVVLGHPQTWIKNFREWAAKCMKEDLEYERNN